MGKVLFWMGCCAALTGFAQIKAVAEPGTNAAAIQKTTHGWEIVEWPSAEVAAAGEVSVYRDV